MRLLLNTCGVAVILLSLVWFAVNNAQPVPVLCNPSIRVEFPLWAMILVPFFAGVVVGNMLDMVQRFKLRQENRKLRKAVSNKTSP